MNRRGNGVNHGHAEENPIPQTRPESGLQTRRKETGRQTSPEEEIDRPGQEARPCEKSQRSRQEIRARQETGARKETGSREESAIPGQESRSPRQEARKEARPCQGKETHASRKEARPRQETRGQACREEGRAREETRSVRQETRRKTDLQTCVETCCQAPAPKALPKPTPLGKPTPKSSAKPRAYTAQELAIFRVQLVQQLELVHGNLRALSADNLKRSPVDANGDISTHSTHMADHGTDNFDRELALNLASGRQESIYDIEEAIRRIDEGTYGVCESCGGPIEHPRLKALPFAKKCVACQSASERGRTRYRPFGGTLAMQQYNTPDESAHDEPQE